MLIVGEKEVEEGKLSIRRHGEGDAGSMTIAEFVEWFGGWCDYDINKC